MNAASPSAIAVPAWLPGWLESTWHLLAAYPLLLALVIVALGLGLAFLVRGFILFWGLKITARTDAELIGKLVRIGAGVAALVVAYISLVTALHVLPVSEKALSVTTRVIVSFLVLQLIRSALKASHVALDILGKIQDRFALVEERTLPLFDLILTVVIVAAGAYSLLQIWNIDATAWLASAGIIGIAVGFAARDTLANLFAGFFIIADAPYKLGDYVVLDSGERGEVTKVGIRSTRLLTRDDVEVTIPNSVIANAKIMNESGGRWMKYRIRIQVGVAYGSDVHQVVEVLENTAKDHSKVCQDPPPRVRMRGFGNSSLDFELLCWIERPVLRGAVAHDLYMAVYDALNSHGIEIPFPQRDLWVRRMPESDNTD
ncbi:MAG: mechanosensitive ion channel family protein [Desulfobacteraceae bacterium]|nr:mechanosensitive ion channel family protein [Desulfobacteraceae bacterium]